MGGDGHDAVTGEVIRDFESVGDLALFVGGEVGLPEGGGDEVFAEEVIDVGFIAAAADVDALVAAVAVFEGFWDEGVDGGVVADAEEGFAVEDVVGVWGLVVYQAEDTFVHGVESEVGVCDGLLGGVFDGGGDAEFAGGEDGVL